MQMFRQMSVLERMLFVLLLFAAGVGSWDLFFRFIHESRVPYMGDSNFFMTVGRGILNGLMPYRDLIETKPPAIFLLSAASLWLSGDMVLAHLVQVCAIAVVCVALITPVCLRTSSLPYNHFLSLLAGVVVSLALILYSADRSGEFYPESFGAAFGLLYVWILLSTPANVTLSWRLGAALCLLGAIGFKEPFVFTLLAAALILWRNRKTFHHIFLFPLLMASVLGSVLLALLGWFQAYVFTYLPFMIWQRPQAANDPLWVRGLFADLVWQDFMAFSPFLGILLALIFLGVLYLNIRKQNAVRQSVVLTAILFAPIAGASYAITFLHSKPWAQILLACSIVAWICVYLQWQSRGKGQEGEEYCWRIFRLLLAGYLMILAPGTVANFLGHHLVFLIPSFAALLFSILDWKSDHSGKYGLFITIAVFASFTLLFHNRVDLRARRENLLGSQIIAEEIAQSIDVLLSSCGINRYMHVGSFNIPYFAFTSHSPLGPGFFQAKLNNGLLHASFERNLHSTEILVVGSEIPTLREADGLYIQSNFSRTPFPCARLWDPPNGVSVLFRVSE
ncbi:hypothetical protein FJZ27_00865 [Candidatus Peribacteria bacterium]|nr:hypothetical protein [Candidatus Peribacteria bacterium]